ncbi:NAD-dependent epimerase/dehydratase family protein [Brevibacterium sp. LS14]|uniref:NAD-dependent epimerase/dehydratase domain-containing protein n=1 Tax=Brevibacterium casei S18 TaxID=1229781 RepID=K9ANC3_9MICO|nr:NAD-dependent epimerase/dehydratase family protein [Brevibacterium casei]EKU47566.1 hypothetical protein C272_07472 [Brevibacterium casei S18]NJE67781.1 NAD-dependent epimerase/dehydratase family protein [Brevibacterium sp. LS14]
MRVAVVGATGNVGTAVLDELAHTPEVSSVLGIARRLPDTDAAPYSESEWASIDIGAAVSQDVAIARLADAFTGADAVIHLAWLIQPNSDRTLLRRVNVDGTAGVAAAVAEAQVPHLVVASSVGAYSPDDTRQLRDEDWPTGGIPSSHYSVDKAAQERVLDEFSSQHPNVRVTRMRPALIFAAHAASEIQRYFLGEWMPLQMLRTGSLPFLPVPSGLRGLQAVHSSDAARAYVAAVLRGGHGAYNICADDVLGPPDLATLLDHGRAVRVPTPLVRAALGIGHDARLVAADEGWLDMGVSVPLMDNAKAKQDLGWRPEHSASDAARDLLDGLREGTGAASVPLRDRDVADQVSRTGPTAESALAARETRSRSDSVDWDLIGLYVSDHLSGATAGAARIARMAEAFIDTPVYAPLSELADEIRRERGFVAELVTDLDLRRRRLVDAATWTLERLGRLKPNGRLLRRSPMTLVLETELMRSAIMGKLGMWQTLRDNADALGLAAEVFDDLAENSRRQLRTLDAVHDYARTRAFRSDSEVHDQDSSQSPVRPE